MFPYFHYYNFACFAANPLITEEVGRLIYQLEQRFGPLVIFEHGGVTDGNGLQSIYHAHFHAIGGLEGFNVIEYMRIMLSGGLSPEEVYPHIIFEAPNYNFLLNLSRKFKGSPYLFIQQKGLALFAEDPENRFKSQITQRAMHRFFSNQEMDWKKLADNENFARESARRIANAVAFCERGEYMPHQF